MTTSTDPHRVQLGVNGRIHDVVVDARCTLADVLRGDLGLTGTHLGCEQGACGACTVLLDGEPVRACLTLAVQADGRDVETVEGVVSRQGPAFVDAFVDAFAFQCGFCSPGVLVTTAALADGGRMDDTEVDDALAGHLCRCTGYASIRAGVRRALTAASGQESDA